MNVADHESTMKWRVDVTDFTRAMNEAKRSIKMADAQFKESTASMGRWSKSTEGVSAKITQLQSKLEGEQRVLDVLKAKWNDMTEEQRENTAAGQKLAIEIKNQEAAVKSTESSIARYNDQLDQLEAEQKDSDSATGKLTGTIKEQETELASLKKAYQDAVLEYGKNSDEAQALATEIDSLSSELADNKQQMSDAERAANELDKSLDDVGDSANDAEGGFTVLKGAMANLVAEGISRAVDGIKELGRHIVDLGKESINNYAQYEQLVGGVETLFGAGGQTLEQYAKSVGKTTGEVKSEYKNLMTAQTTVLSNAAKAYKTAGMSANDYMENVTSFSASLIQGLDGDTAKAAKIADQAIIDMSDNANKMGTDIGMIQNAYQGFAKGNFTMLDNLKLGYGGTKEEMLRLVKDAGVVEDSVKSIDDVSYDKIIEAIHKVQTDMGITGTTAKEAATTIEGSGNMMKAAWSNLLTEFAKSDGDIGAAFDTFVESAMTYLGNLLPRVQELMGNVVAFIREKLQESAPDFLAFVDTVGAVFKTLGDVIAASLGWIMDNGNTIVAILGAIAAAVGVYTAYTTALNVMKNGWMALGVVQKAVAAGQAALNAVMALNPIGLVVAAVVGLIAAFVLLWKKSDKFRQFWINLWKGIQKTTGNVIDSIVKWFKEAWRWIQKTWDKAEPYFTVLWKAIKAVFNGVVTYYKTVFGLAWKAITTIWNVAVKFFTTIWNGIKAVFSPVVNFFKTTFDNAWKAITTIWNTAVAFFTTIWNGIKLVFATVVSFFQTTFNNALTAIKNIWNTVVSYFTGIWNGIKAVFASVASWFGNIFTQAVNSIKSAFNTVKSFMQGVWNGIKGVFNAVGTWFRGKFNEAVNAIKGVFNGLVGFFSNIWNTIKGVFTNLGSQIGSAVGGAVKTAINGVISSAESAINWAIGLINGAIDLINKLPGVSVGKVGKVSFPRLAKGGVVDAATMALIGEDGAEAVVPLEKNRQWIAKVVKGMLEEMDVQGVKNAVGSITGGMNGVSNNIQGATTQNVTFNQYNTSPKALDRLSIYRDTNNMLFAAKVGLKNV